MQEWFYRNCTRLMGWGIVSVVALLVWAGWEMR